MKKRCDLIQKENTDSPECSLKSKPELAIVSDEQGCKQSEHDKTRDRAIRFFKYLKEFTQLQTTTVRDIDQYEKVLWLHEIPREKGCFFAAWDNDRKRQESDTWIEIKKPSLKPPPIVPRDLEPWLEPEEITNSSLEFPVIREQIVISVPDTEDEDQDREPQTEIISLDDHPEIKKLWEKYVENKWWPWAEEDRRLQKVQKIYTDLFSIYQKQQRLWETYEAVLGFGLLTWKTPHGSNIKRHVITVKANISFEPQRGVIKVEPTAEGAEPIIEQDMLESEEQPGVTEHRVIDKQIEKMGGDLWDGVHPQAILTSWVNAVSRAGHFDSSFAPQETIGQNPLIHFAPALVLRKRTERNFVALFNEMKQQLENGAAIPENIKSLVSITESDQESSPDFLCLQFRHWGRRFGLKQGEEVQRQDLAR